MPELPPVVTLRWCPVCEEAYTDGDTEICCADTRELTYVLASESESDQVKSQVPGWIERLLLDAVELARSTTRENLCDEAVVDWTLRRVLASEPILQRARREVPALREQVESNLKALRRLASEPQSDQEAT